MEPPDAAQRPNSVMVTMIRKWGTFGLAVALCLLGACVRSEDEAEREGCGSGSMCAEPPLDRQCVDQDNASICAVRYPFVVLVTGTGLLPGSSLTVVSAGQSAGYPVNDTGALDPGTVRFPAVSDAPASFTFTGISTGGVEINGSATLTPSLHE